MTLTAFMVMLVSLAMPLTTMGQFSLQQPQVNSQQDSTFSTHAYRRRSPSIWKDKRRRATPISKNNNSPSDFEILIFAHHLSSSPTFMKERNDEAARAAATLLTLDSEAALGKVKASLITSDVASVTLVQCATFSRVFLMERNPHPLLARVQALLQLHA